MKWIEYDYVCNADKGINLHKKVEYNEANLAIAEVEAYNGEYTIIEDGVNIKPKPLAIELGGTGSTTVEGAREKLGVAAAIPKISMNAPTAADNIEAGYAIGKAWLRPNYTITNFAYNTAADDFVSTACVTTKAGQTFTFAGNGDDKVISAELAHGSANGWLYCVVTPDATVSSANLVVGNETVSLTVGEANTVQRRYTGESLMFEATYETANIASTGTITVENLTIIDEAATLEQVDEICRDITDETAFGYVLGNLPSRYNIVPYGEWTHINSGEWKQTSVAKPQIIITSNTSVSAYCLKDDIVLTAAQVDGTRVFEVPEYGNWSVYINDVKVGTIAVNTVRQYTTLDFFDTQKNYVELFDGSRVGKDFDDNTELTGGWTGITSTYDDYIEFFCSGGSANGNTNKAIDMSDYSLLAFDWAHYSYTSFAGTTVKLMPSDTTVLSVSHTWYPPPYLFAFDVSALTEEQITISMWRSTNGNAKPYVKIYFCGLFKADDWQSLAELAGVQATSIAELLTKSDVLLSDGGAVSFMAARCTGDFMIYALLSADFLSALATSPYSSMLYANEHWAKFLAMVA